jgi:uncharacterized protein YbaR (Trm112 family)
VTAAPPTYRVRPNVSRAGYAKPAPGELVRHVDAQGQPTDNWRLCCPLCGRRMSAFSAQEGPDDAPTLVQPLRCGCVARCGRWFRITAGRAVAVDPPGRAGADLFAAAAALPGVLGAPRLPPTP